MISAVILTKNEEKNIIPCLESVKWCDEIIVIDDFSSDNTLTKIKTYNLKIKIYQRKLNGNFSSQRNYGLEKANGTWVLFVDADETISKKLAEEIKSQISYLNAPNYAGFYIKRRDYFWGKELKYGETGKAKFIRLAKKNAGKWIREIHETWEIKGETKTLQNPIFHFSHPTISSFLTKLNYYTDLLVQKWKHEGKKIYFWEIFLFPLGKFFQNYFFRLGFLDGTPGLIMAIMMSFHSFLARGKFWLSKNQNA